jgi:uncharacterized protein YciI
MAGKLFAVMRMRGPRWNEALPMEGQEEWRAHADFMNALVAEGFALLGGPLLGSREVLIIVRSSDEREVERRLAEDCWSVNDLLRTVWVRPWWLRLGSLAAPHP